MVTVSVTRCALESDPLEVIGDARRQAVGEREARRLGLKHKYQACEHFIDLQVIGRADQKMRNFLLALRGFGVTGCNVTIDAADDEKQLGDAADDFDVCLPERHDS